MSLFTKLLGRKAELESEPADEAPKETRTSNRVGAYKVASVTYPTGYVRRGVVIDLSPTGARLRFSQRGGLPDTLKVKIAGMAGERRAEVVWQEDTDAGIRFLD